MSEEITRRDVIRVGGVVFVSGALGALQALLTGCGSKGSSSESSGSGSCVASTNGTRGPYFVDNQSDPNISNDAVDTTCSPLANAQVHIWHCNAQGIYSDVQAGSNGGGGDYTGENFLRGYQYTDSTGQVSFTTVYPGWYSGRAVHIHLKVRVFDGSGNVTTEATTQLFFDDSITDAVYTANSDYSRTGSRDVRNSSDSIYDAENPALLLSLSGSPTTSYTGSISIGVNVGSLYGG